jgi:hypothetical protein
MNGQVKKKMFTFEIHLSRMKGGSSLGDKQYSVTTMFGYLKEEMKIVTYGLGKEVTSSAQLYIDGTDMSKVDAKDLVTVGIRKKVENTEGIDLEEVESEFVPILVDRQILRRDNFYKPNNEPDVGVIYLA